MSHKALVVDDDMITLHLIEIILKELGYAVTTAINAEDALELLDTEEFYLVVTDLEMGGTNGLTVINRAKKYRRDTIVVVITGCYDKDSRVSAYRGGADEFLLKPFSFDELLGCIHLHTRGALPSYAAKVSA